MLAAIVLTLLPEVLRPVKDYRMVIYSLLLIVLMITRPQGLLGTRELVAWPRAGRAPAAARAGARRERAAAATSSTSRMQFGGLKAVADLDARRSRRASWSG